MPILQIHELYTSLEAWHEEVTRPSIIPKCTRYKSKVSSSKNIPTIINFVRSRASCWQNLHTLLTVFRNNGIMLQKYSIMPTLCLMAPDIVLCSKSCRHYPRDEKVLLENEIRETSLELSTWAQPLSKNCLFLNPARNSKTKSDLNKLERNYLGKNSLALHPLLLQVFL